MGKKKGEQQFTLNLFVIPNLFRDLLSHNQDSDPDFNRDRMTLKVISSTPSF